MIKKETDQANINIFYWSQTNMMKSKGSQKITQLIFNYCLYIKHWSSEKVLAGRNRKFKNSEAVLHK